MSIETEPKEENRAVLRELDELIDYMESKDQQDDLIDPAFFIGNLSENTPDVPTLTSVAPEMAAETEKPEAPKQQGLFSARMEHLKQELDDIEPIPELPESLVGKNGDEAQQSNQISSEEISEMVDSIVDEYLPKIEARLRERLTAYLLKNSSPF